MLVMLTTLGVLAYKHAAGEDHAGEVCAGSATGSRQSTRPKSTRSDTLAGTAVCYNRSTVSSTNLVDVECLPYAAKAVVWC
jgi:hypothetical protein